MDILSPLRLVLSGRLLRLQQTHSRMLDTTVLGELMLATLIALLFSIAVAEAESPSRPIAGTQRVVVVATLKDRSGQYQGVTEERVAVFIRDLIAARLAAPASGYERPRGDLPVVVVPWSEFRRQFISDWDLVFLWRIGIDELQNPGQSSRQAATSYWLVYDFIDCADGILRPQTSEQVFVSSWVAGASMDQFYEALGKDIEHTLTPAFRDLREDSYQPSEPQQVTALPAATLREFFDDASHIQVTMQQGGNSLYVLDPEANRNRAQWSVATAREMFGREFSADARRRLTVSEERGREELRYRQLEITTLTQDHPPLLAERQFTFLTIGAALRWPRYEQSLLLPLQPISILVPPDRSTYERSYQFALSTLLTELTDVSGFRWHDPGSETEDNPMNRR